MLHYEPVCLSPALRKAPLSHVTALLDTPLQQEALVGFKQLQLVGLLELVLPKGT